MKNSVLECRELTKKYGKKEVLHSLNLKLEQGKIYGLIGRNGAGKTTLLSLLSAQNPKTQGEILLDGQNVWENQEALKHIYFSREINPNSTVYSGLKVKELLKIAAAYLPDWDKEMANSLIQFFHLDVKKRISKLSKGMTSMITIILALASKAEFTFLDEPVQVWMWLPESSFTGCCWRNLRKAAEPLWSLPTLLRKRQICLKK